MYGCDADHRESWAPENRCFPTLVLRKTLESPLHFEQIQPVHSKGNPSWIFIGRTGAEDEAPILGQPDSKSQLIGKDTDAGQDWGQEEKETTADEMVGWRHGSMDRSLSKSWETVSVLQSMGRQRDGHELVTHTNAPLSEPGSLQGHQHLPTTSSLENNHFLSITFSK